jgi:hypothetical protein
VTIETVVAAQEQSFHITPYEEKKREKLNDLFIYVVLVLRKDTASGVIDENRLHVLFVTVRH